MKKHIWWTIILFIALVITVIATAGIGLVILFLILRTSKKESNIEYVRLYSDEYKKMLKDICRAIKSHDMFDIIKRLFVRDNATIQYFESYSSLSEEKEYKKFSKLFAYIFLLADRKMIIDGELYENKRETHKDDSFIEKYLKVLNIVSKVFKNTPDDEIKESIEDIHKFNIEKIREEIKDKTSKLDNIFVEAHNNIKAVITKKTGGGN
jgi:hypothetical protein